MKHFYCSFCGREDTEVEVLVAAHEGLLICDFCVSLCVDIINNHRQEKQNLENPVNTPDEPT